jgi:hypothetical protein
LSKNSNCIILADEGLRFIETVEFAEYVKNSDNYFLFVSRSGMLKKLAYSVDSILEFCTERNGNEYITKSFKSYLGR